MGVKRSIYKIIALALSISMLTGCDRLMEMAGIGAYPSPQPVQEEIVTESENTVEPETIEEPEPEEVIEPLEKYWKLLYINPYIFGWLKIDNTLIDAPVVYTPGSQNYFLHRALDGSEESTGTLFVAVNWRKENNNTIIYGHNMKDGTAFGSLAQFADESFGRSHHRLHFDTLYEERDFELYGVFYSQIDDEDLETDEAREEDDKAVEEGELDLGGEQGYWDPYRIEKDEDDGRFRYYYFTDLSSKDDFEYFANSVKERSLYDMGIDAEWGDEFVTLSTCSYHVRNGRFVVVGIRKDDSADR